MGVVVSHRCYVFTLTIFIGSLLVGCKSTTVVESKPVAFVSPLSIVKPLYPQPTNKVIAAKQLTQLTESQERDFLTWFHHPARQDIKPHLRVYDYLSSLTGNFEYRGDTYTAEEAYVALQGNCLSLALLTSALAELVDIEIEFQVVNTQPVYRKIDNVIVSSSHVVTILYDPTFVVKPNQIVIQRPRVIVDYFPVRSNIRGKSLSKKAFLAMYYRNLASDFLLKHQYPDAYWHARAAIDLAPESPENINTLALIYAREGQKTQAVALYQLAVVQKITSINLLNNYIELIRHSNPDKASMLNEYLEQLDDPNPYNWVLLGDSAMAKGRLRKAQRMYEKALSKAHYLSDVHAKLAGVQFEFGHYEEAGIALRNAKRYAWDDEEERLYQAKLFALKSLNY